MGRGICSSLIRGLQPSSVLARAVGEVCPWLATPPCPAAPAQIPGKHPAPLLGAFPCPAHAPRPAPTLTEAELGLMGADAGASVTGGDAVPCSIWGSRMGAVSGKFGSGWGRVRERTRIGIQSSECLGLMLGHPFLEKFGYKSGRQMCGPCPPPPPPSLGGKHSRLPGDGPKHLGPPQLFIPGLPLLLRPGLASQSTPELSVLSGGSSPCLGRRPQQQACLNPTRDWALTTSQRHVC